jgi:hypothetical protein
MFLAVNGGTLFWLLIETVNGKSLGLMLFSAFFTVIVVNAVVWLTFRHLQKQARALVPSQTPAMRVGMKPQTQLKLGIVLVCLGALQWVFAAFAQTRTFEMFPGSDSLFAVLTILLGVALVFFAMRRRAR